MSNFKIIGPSNPEVGKEIIYKTSISNFPASLPGQINPVATNPFTEQVKWSIYILEYGKWTLKEKNNKTGPTANYTFTEVSLKRKGIRIVALFGNEKATLDIKPLDTIERKIVKVELCDALGNLQTKPFAYSQTVLARVHCLNLDNCTVHVTLWEDDAPGKGHNEINKNNKAITKSELVSNGIADVKFKLAPDFAKMADAQLAKGDKSEGKTHEYYVTAEVFRQKTVSSNNINVTNPNNKTADTKAKATPQKPAAKKPVTKPVTAKPTPPAAKKGPSKKEEKGILETVGGTIYDWGESKFKTVASIFPDPMEIINSVAKLDMGDSWWKNKEEKGGCQNCNEKIKLKQLQEIFTEADPEVLKIALTTYNDYMEEFGMNTCWNKAHFFAQASIEVGKTFTLKNGEILNYSTTRLISGDYSSGFVKGDLAAKKGGHYTSGDFHTRPFAYFDNHKNEAERYGRKDLNKNNDKIIQKANEIKIADLAYGPTSAKGKELGNTRENDGSRFIGRGLIQLTGRANYADVAPHIKKHFPSLDILTDEHVKHVGTNVKIAVLSSMAYWSGKKRKINKVANGQENVDKVSRLIGTDVDWKGKAKSFKEVTSVKFKVKECKWGKIPSNATNDKGTVVVVSGKSTKLGDFKSNNKQWPVYKTTVYQNMSLETYNKLERDNKLPDPNYTTYLTRDAHSLSAKDRSIKRYGSSNEAPPGIYYLNKGIRGQRYHVYLGDQEGGCSITGVDGWRGGIAIHGGFPAGTEGCLTTHTSNYGNRTKRQEINIKVKELIDNIPDFDNNTDDRPVRLILKERQVTKEGKLWNGKVE